MRCHFHAMSICSHTKIGAEHDSGRCVNDWDENSTGAKAKRRGHKKKTAKHMYFHESSPLKAQPKCHRGTTLIIILFGLLSSEQWTGTRLDYTPHWIYFIIRVLTVSIMNFDFPPQGCQPRNRICMRDVCHIRAWAHRKWWCEHMSAEPNTMQWKHLESPFPAQRHILLTSSSEHDSFLQSKTTERDQSPWHIRCCVALATVGKFRNRNKKNGVDQRGEVYKVPPRSLSVSK